MNLNRNRLGVRAFGLVAALTVFSGAGLVSKAHASFEWLPADLLKLILNLTDRPTVGAMHDTNQYLRGETNRFHKPFQDAKQELRKSWPTFDGFHNGFVTIPAGKLSVSPLALNPPFEEFESFEVSVTPVTRQDWIGVLGEKPPAFPCGDTPEFPSLTDKWDGCPTCPVTCVNRLNADGSPAEIQQFIERLNEKSLRLYCTYRLLTDSEAQYVQLGDASGLPIAGSFYSLGVGDGNWAEYFSILGYTLAQGVSVFDLGSLEGAPTGDVYPVGQKKQNAFGVEIGNVRRITSDQTLRGGSYANPPNYHRWDALASELAPGERLPNAGFSLARECTRPLEI